MIQDNLESNLITTLKLARPAVQRSSEMAANNVLISVDFLFDDLNFVVAVVVDGVVVTFPNVFAFEDLSLDSDLLGFANVDFFR